MLTPYSQNFRERVVGFIALSGGDTVRGQHQQRHLLGVALAGWLKAMCARARRAATAALGYAFARNRTRVAPRHIAARGYGSSFRRGCRCSAAMPGIRHDQAGLPPRDLIVINPDLPDEIAFGQLRAPISTVKSNSYAGSSSRILRDPTGERRNWRFCQPFRGLRSCRPNPSGGSGIKYLLKSSQRSCRQPTSLAA